MYRYITAKTRLSRLKKTLAAWVYYRRIVYELEIACNKHIAQKNAAKLKKVFTAWDVELCAERHEDNMVGFAERTLGGLVARRVMKSWFETARTLYVERRVTRTYWSRRRRVMLMYAMSTWGHWKNNETRVENQYAKASRHLTRRMKSRAWRGWHEEAAAVRHPSLALALTLVRCRHHLS